MEEPPKRGLSFYWQKENWLHFKRSLLKQGRVDFEEIEFEEGVEEDKKAEIIKSLHALDSQEPLLKPVVEDKCKLNRQRHRQVLVFPLFREQS